MDREQDNDGDVVEELRGKHTGRAQAVMLAPIIIRSMQERVARTGSVMPFSTPRERESSSPRETATP